MVEETAEIRQKRLGNLMEQDQLYLLWMQLRERYRPDFEACVSSLPEETAAAILGYAQSAEMAQQRLLNIACEKMIFPDEK